MTPKGEALIKSARMGDINGVRAALAAGANIHASDDEALRWAAVRGHTDVVRILLAAGADPAIALKNTIKVLRDGVVATLDACAAVLISDQRTALLAVAHPDEFVQLRAIAASTEKRSAVRR